MVRFETTRFGTLEVDDNAVIDFPYGLLGFPHLKRYILIDYEDTPIKWLQALDDPEVAFIVMDPCLLVPEYSVATDAKIGETLQLQEADDIAALMIVRVEQGEVIPNLKGPLLFNTRLKLGLQCVLE